MIVTHLIFAFLLAFIFSALLVGAFRRGRGEGGFWASMWFLFLILFVAIWAGGAWVTPFGPVLFGVAWLPFIIIGFLFFLLLAALIPPSRPRTTTEAVREEIETRSAISGFFWVFVLALLIAIIAAYL